MCFCTIAINTIWNKLCGPGGGARRLHHHLSILVDFDKKAYGDEISIDVSDKEIAFAHGMTSWTLCQNVLINANDNFAYAIASNDNYDAGAVAAAA